MAQHTPGPWTDSPISDSGVTVRSSDQRDVAWVLSQMPSETKANARLIAAAPDLLEAARRLSYVPCERTGNIHCSMLPADSTLRPCPPCAIRAAIAKATQEE